MNNINRSPLTTDEFGLSFFIQREGESLPPNQYIRELTLNGFEAGATSIWIDNIEDTETPGRLLFRLTDNGHGMTEQKLREHIKSLFRTGKELGPNHGMGARVATLARNPSGVTWASRVRRDENMVRVVRDQRGVFALENWQLDKPEPDGSTRNDVVDPDPGYLTDYGMLEGKDGTVVILHGNGKDATWDSSNSVREYINRRFWTLPGEVKVWQETIHGSDTPGAWRTALGANESLKRQSVSRGKFPVFVDDLGLIDIRWALLKETADQPGTGTRHGFIGVLLGNECFEWTTKSNTAYRMTQFGIMTRPVQNRVVIVAEFPQYEDDNINGWRMTIGRDSIERAGGRNSIDWAKIGEAFVQQMPPEIAALLVAQGTETDFLRIVRQRLGENWNEITRYLPEGKNPEGGENKAVEGIGTFPAMRKRRRKKPVKPIMPRIVIPVTPSDKTRQSKPKEEEMLGATKEQVYDIPKVQWVPAKEFGGKAGRAATYSRNANLILMVKDHIFIQQAIVHACKEYKNIAPALITKRIEAEFGIETLAKVLHVNILHRDENFSKDDFDNLVSDDALTLSVAGMQAVMERIHKSLHHLGR